MEFLQLVILENIAFFSSWLTDTKKLVHLVKQRKIEKLRRGRSPLLLGEFRGKVGPLGIVCPTPSVINHPIDRVEFWDGIIN